MAENTDITQQATAPTPKKKPATEKNPKRVAAGKMVAKRTTRAREAQKKAAEEELANNKTPTAEPVTDGPAPQPSGGEKSFYSSLTTTQWLAVGSLVVSLIGLYYKREEINNALNPQTAQLAEPQLAEPQQAPRGLRNMD